LQSRDATASTSIESAVYQVFLNNVVKMNKEPYEITGEKATNPGAIKRLPINRFIGESDR
jgi:hypothetical protein